jgi:hypothetical protein
MGNENKPCCAADAPGRTRQVTINGLLTGITTLDEIIGEVKSQDLHSDQEIRAALPERVKVYNYIPRMVEKECADVLPEEFRKSVSKT